MSNGRLSVSQTFNFDSAHKLERRIDRPEYEQLHGHSFTCEVTLSGEALPEMDWLLDFGTFRETLNEIAGKLDHKFLNIIPGLQVSTMENLARWICDRVGERLPTLATVNPTLRVERITLKRLTIGQTCVYEPAHKEK